MKKEVWKREEKWWKRSARRNARWPHTSLRGSRNGFCIRIFLPMPPTRLSPQEAGRIQLKALWGGHTAALQFMLCIQFPIGERKHAIRSRRLHEDEIVTACTAGNSTEMVLICLYVWLPKHVLHELSLLKYRVRRAFLHKMRPDAMQKNWKFHVGAMR